MAMLFTEEQIINIDTAYPLAWADKMRELGVNPKNFVWSYNENRISGAPVDLAALFLERYSGLPTVEIQDPNHVGAIISAQSLVNRALNLE